MYKVNSCHAINKSRRITQNFMLLQNKSTLACFIMQDKINKRCERALRRKIFNQLIFFCIKYSIYNSNDITVITVVIRWTEYVLGKEIPNHVNKIVIATDLRSAIKLITPKNHARIRPSLIRLTDKLLNDLLTIVKIAQFPYLTDRQLYNIITRKNSSIRLCNR